METKTTFPLKPEAIECVIDRLTSLFDDYYGDLERGFIEDVIDTVRYQNLESSSEIADLKENAEDDFMNYINNYFIYYSKCWGFLQDNGITDFEHYAKMYDAYDIAQISFYAAYDECYNVVNDVQNILQDYVDEMEQYENDLDEYEEAMQECVAEVEEIFKGENNE